MSFKKIDYDDIDWRPHWGKKGFLYRSNSQAKFEQRILDCILENRPLSYFGCEDDEGPLGQITFCSERYNLGLFYTEHWMSPANDIPLIDTFTHFPLIMALNIENYRDRLFESTVGEGIIIQDPINLEDITILFSKNIDRFNQEHPVKNETACILKKTFQNRVNKYIRLNILSKEDLIEKYKKNPEQISNELIHFRYQQLGKMKKDEVNAIIKNYIKALESVLR
jgi:hypothetical protein